MGAAPTDPDTEPALTLLHVAAIVQVSTALAPIVRVMTVRAMTVRAEIAPAVIARTTVAGMVAGAVLAAQMTSVARAPAGPKEGTIASARVPLQVIVDLIVAAQTAATVLPVAATIALTVAPDPAARATTPAQEASRAAIPARVVATRVQEAAILAATSVRAMTGRAMTGRAKAVRIPGKASEVVSVVADRKARAPKAVTSVEALAVAVATAVPAAPAVTVATAVPAAPAATVRGANVPAATAQVEEVLTQVAQEAAIAPPAPVIADHAATASIQGSWSFTTRDGTPASSRVLVPHDCEACSFPHPSPSTLRQPSACVPHKMRSLAF